MGWITALAVYFVIWWLTLFMVLPFGVERDDKVETGNDPGAPKRSRIVVKLAINTGVAFVVWLAIFLVDRFGLITLSDITG